MAHASGKAERGAQRKIELFSGSYFAACTMGGIIGMSVGLEGVAIEAEAEADGYSLWSYAYHGYAAGFGGLGVFLFNPSCN